MGGYLLDSDGGVIGSPNPGYRPSVFISSDRWAELSSTDPLPGSAGSGNPQPHTSGQRANYAADRHHPFPWDAQLHNLHNLHTCETGVR